MQNDINILTVVVTALFILNIATILYGRVLFIETLRVIMRHARGLDNHQERLEKLENRQT